MDTGDFIITFIRIFALVSVAAFVIYLMIKFKKAGKLKNKLLHRCVIIFFVVFILFLTLFPYYLIVPNKIDLSSFDSIIDFHEKRKENYYHFDTKNYGGEFYVGDIEELAEYKGYIKEFAKNEVEFIKSEKVFSKEENGINWLSAPVVATRSDWTLGFRDDVKSKMLLWDDKNIVYISYWYHARGLFIPSLTFYELFYKKTLDFEEIFKSYETNKEELEERNEELYSFLYELRLV